jgi:hypothetical protein
MLIDRFPRTPGIYFYGLLRRCYSRVCFSILPIPPSVDMRNISWPLRPDEVHAAEGRPLVGDVRMRRDHRPVVLRSARRRFFLFRIHDMSIPDVGQSPTAHSIDWEDAPPPRCVLPVVPDAHGKSRGPARIPSPRGTIWYPSPIDRYERRGPRNNPVLSSSSSPSIFVYFSH